VRNTEDGAVEIVAQGPLSRLQELVERCRRGPAAAKVTAVDVVWEEEVISELSGFHIRR
jgi:acylphosphatase